jgi:arylsulfatase A-like enzyme
MPNVVVVMCDTLRADHLGCYGATEVRTPHLDRFAAEATVFENNYAASYPTVPNRLDIWTGRYSFLSRGWTPLDADDVTLPGVLDDHGVTTKLVFDTPMLAWGARPFGEEFAYWERVRGHHTDPVVSDPSASTALPAEPYKIKNRSAAEDYLRNSDGWDREADYVAPRTFAAGVEWLERNRRREAFFLMIDAWDPHEPFDAPEHYLDAYVDEDGADVEDVIYPVYGHADYLTEAERDRVRARYAAAVSMVDRGVGELLDALDRFGLADDTVVIVTSDHGHLFGEHGLQGKPTGIHGRLYEESIHTPLLVRDPSGGPDRIDALTQPPDLPPTVLEYLDSPVPDSMQGRSLRPLLRGEGDAPRDYAITGRFPEGYETGESTAADFDGWTGPERVIQPVTVTGDRWALVCHPDPAESELYDLDADPGQASDVAGDHPDVVEELRAAYLAFADRHDATATMVDPWIGGDYRRESLSGDTETHVFSVADDRFAHLSEHVAVDRLPTALTPDDVESLRFDALVDEDPEAFVYLNQQYYRADELVE